MTHRCPPTCHRCPDLDDNVMPGCMGTAALQGPGENRLFTYCTCLADQELPTEDNMAVRIAALEARVAALENNR